MKANQNLACPDISKRDKVKIYAKRKPGDKSQMSSWSKDIYTLEDISGGHGIQNL